MAIEEVARYMVLKALAGRQHIVDAIYECIVGGGSVSSVAARHGLSKHQLRGYVNRVMEHSGSYARAAAFVKALYSHVKKIRPVVRCKGDSCTCSLCRDRVVPAAAENHIKYRHWDVVEEYVEAVLALVLRSVKRERGG